MRTIELQPFEQRILTGYDCSVVFATLVLDSMVSVARTHQQNLFAVDELPENLAAWQVAAQNDRLLAEVVFNRPLTTVYHYLVSDPLRDLIGPGRRIEAPFGRGNRPTTGFCVGLSTQAPAGRALKSLTGVLDREPLADARLLELTRWIADRYLCGWGQVLESVIPAGVKSKAGTRDLVFFELPPDCEERLRQSRLTAKQQAVVNALKSAGRPLRADELSEAANCGISPIHSLRDKGLVVSRKDRMLVASAELPPPEPHREIHLNSDQHRAVRDILAVLQSGLHKTLLLHGVTGSGKTEVYIRAIEETVGYGRQAIVLVPEISLTPQTIRRFRSRFPSVAVLHSHLTDAERHAHWQEIASGRVQVVVGARSAVFAPTPHLGLIVIDEEHETSFKQDTTPRYHAREVARRRAEQERIPLLLGSATPTLESWLRVLRKEDALISMPKRVERLPLPPVIVVDTRNDPQVRQGAAIGRALFTAMQAALKDDGQVILFLNVRGFAPVLWCRACGEGVRCPHCDISLTWHKQRGVALCHSCDFEVSPPPTHCPKCGHAGLTHLGLGTERLEHEVRKRFPDISCLRMDSDTMKQRGAHQTALDAFRAGDVRILLGTQMIAKGLDFPNVTLVGVIDADTQLHQPDLRAAERTFQLIAQVAGRTGRSARGGRVFVQSASPEQPAIQFAAEHDYLGFARAELEHRKVLQVPPFTHLVRVIFRGPVEQDVDADARLTADRLRAAAGELDLPVRLLGPAPCLVTRLKGLFRYHLQLTSPGLVALRQTWLAIAADVPTRKDVEIVVDVDPMNLR